jgi:hypothetical protein
MLVDEKYFRALDLFLITGETKLELLLEVWWLG